MTNTVERHTLELLFLLFCHLLDMYNIGRACKCMTEVFIHSTMILSDYAQTLM